MCIQSNARGTPYRKYTLSRLLLGAGSTFLVRILQKILCVLRSWTVFGTQPVFQSLSLPRACPQLRLGLKTSVLDPKPTLQTLTTQSNLHNCELSFLKLYQNSSLSRDENNVLKSANLRGVKRVKRNIK